MDVLVNLVEHPGELRERKVKVRTSTTNGKALEMTYEVFRVAKRHRLCRIDVEQLLHVEDLNAVTLSLAANDHQIILT